MRTFTQQLYRSVKNAEIVVICGKNEILRQSLEIIFKNAPHVHIVGFTTEIPAYMAACDVLYPKPGGLTSTEALVTNTPLIHTAPIPGCESANFRFFKDNRLSFPAKHIKQQIKNGRLLVENPALRADMRKNQAKAAKPDAALKILHLIERQTK